MAHRIQNFEALAATDLRTDALAIAEAGYAALDIGEALARTLRIEGDVLSTPDAEYPLAKRKIFFVGVGKCAFAGAEALEKLLGDRLSGGIAFDVSPLDNRVVTKIETLVGTHPLPSEANEAATARIMDFLTGRTENDLVIMLISGGGSALLCAHDAPMTCTDESALWNALTAHGATIQEINTVRKHTSKARGGGLAFAAYPAEVVSLIVSDVPGNDLSFIASGPTILDTSTVADAEAILAAYGITSANILSETPKDASRFTRVHNRLFLSSRDALDAMREEATNRGYATEVADDRFTGEAREVGRGIAERLRDAAPRTALLYAGESTVTIMENAGAGGRNQELALASLEYLNEGEVILPFSSDGRDNSDYAGAIADAETLAHAQEKQLPVADYLDRHRSYDFFTATGDALSTGYTGTNVSDLIIALKK
ncbi:MAG: DUF4147 domain-containing protein [Candidatus Pacebacteria bacterium]|nr:DUF4147 domain-containing protein [Candidatus Paceibacterota bacterium]